MKFSAKTSPALGLFLIALSCLVSPPRASAQNDAAITEIVRQFNEIEKMLPTMETLFIDASHTESDLGIGAITVWFDPQTLYTKVRNELNAGSSTEVQEMWIQGDTLIFIFERTEYQNDNGDTDVHELRYYLHNGRVIREMSRNAILRNGRNPQLSGVPHDKVDDLDPEYALDLFRSKQEKSEKMSMVARGFRMRNPNLPPLVNQSYRILLDTISPDGQFAVAFSIDGVPNPDWNQWQIDRYAYLDTLGERTYRTHLVSIWNGAIVGDLNTLYDPYGPLRHWTQWSPGAQLFVVGVNARWMSPEAVLYRIENGRNVQVSNLEQELSRMAMQAMTQVNHPYTIDTTEASGFITIEAITDGGRLDVDYRIESKFEGDRYNAYIDMIAQVDPWSGQTTVISAVLPEYIPKPSTWKALATEIITSASRWLGNPPALEDYLQSDTICEKNGVVMLFNRFGDFFNPNNVELIIRRPLFLSGPHQFGMVMSYEPHDFGRYDPISVAMINDELSSILQTPGFVTATQSLYQAYFQSTVVDFQEALRYWDSNPAELQRQKAAYLKRIADQTLPEGGYYLLENDLAARLMESYTTDYDRQLGFLTALRFWLRRECDGTYAEFASMLQKMVKAYDPGYFSTNGLPGRLIEPQPGGDDEDDIIEVVMDEDGALGINEKTPLNLASLQAKLSNFRVAPGEIVEEGDAIPAFKVFLGSSEVLTVTDFGTGDTRSFEARSDNMQLKNGISTGDTFGQVFARQYPLGINVELETDLGGIIVDAPGSERIRLIFRQPPGQSIPLSDPYQPPIEELSPFVLVEMRWQP